MGMDFMEGRMISMERQESLSLFRGLSVHKVVEFVHLNEQYDSDLFLKRRKRWLTEKVF